MRYALICEGACNPARAAIDEAVKLERRDQRYLGGVYDAVSEALVARLRTLRHTAHQLIGIKARCLQCGHERRYGT